MATSQAPRPLTDSEFAALTPDQLTALGFQPAQGGAPADFGGTVYPNPDGIRPVASEGDPGTATRMPNGTKLTSPRYSGKPQMDTSNPAQAQIIPMGAQTIAAKYGPGDKVVPVPSDATVDQGDVIVPVPPDATIDSAPQTPPAATPSGLPGGSNWMDATKHTLDQVAEGGVEAAKGIGKGIWDQSQELNPAVQAYQMATKGLPSYIKDKVDKAVSVLAPLGQAGQIPGAVKDINASPDSAQLYADTLARTGGNALIQGATGALGEGAGNVDTEAFQTAAKQTALDAGKSAFPGTAQALKFIKNYEAAKAAKAAPVAAPAEAAPAAEAPSTAPAKPAVRTRQPILGTPKPGAPDVAANNGYTRPAVLTNPQDIAQAVDDMVKGKAPRPAPVNGVAVENALKTNTPVKTPFDVTQGAMDTINKDVASRVGTPDKPVTPAPKAPPKSAQTQANISGETEALRNRQTTVDGKPVTPDQDFTAALKDSVSRLGNKTAPEEGGPSEGYTPVSHLESDVPARGFLNKMGADEASVVKTDADHQSVQYHRQQIKNGTDQPARLDIDEDGNVIGGDGRHRAIAAIQEGGPSARMKVRVVQHAFKGVE